MIHNSVHVPVLLNEVIQILDPKPGKFFIDGTLGGGGHASAIIRHLEPGGKFLGIDWDESAIEIFKSNVKCQMLNVKCYFANDNYANLEAIMRKHNLPKADGLLLDLGMSSEQLETSGRGFSFSARGGQAADEPLLMTYGRNAAPVKEILEKLSEPELASIIKEYSQEKFAKRIAKAIKERQKIKRVETSGDLAEIIKGAVPKYYERGRIHPATRTFMALRIYANKELENLEKLLKNMTNILEVGGRMAVISFHSMEDKLVKNHFRQLSKVGKLKILTKKPITPTREEIAQNPRARSAKLRAATLNPKP